MLPSSSSTYPTFSAAGSSGRLLPAFFPTKKPDHSSSADQLTESLRSMAISKAGSSLKSSALVASATIGGCLSTEADLQLNREVQALFEKACTQSHDLWKQANQSIDQFRQDVTTMQQETSFILSNLGGRYDQALQLIEIANRIMELKAKTISQVIEFSQQGCQGHFKAYKNLIEMRFYAQSQEIELLSKRLTVLQQADAHELTTLITLQSQQLEMEAQAFDQLFRLGRLSAKKDRQAHENLQKMKELESKITENHQRILRQEKDMQCHKDFKKLDMQEGFKIEQHRIDALTRCRFAQIAAEKTLTTL